MQQIKNGKKIVTALLVVSCIVSGIILASSPAPTFHRLENYSQLDSLIQVQFQKAQINSDQIRTRSVLVDTVLTRKEYRIEVPSRLSKTMFHISLDRELGRYELGTPAKVQFPSTDMDIYVYYENTVLRTLRLTTNPDLDSLQTK